jgi:hypothetical protein
MAYGEIRFTADKRKPFPNTALDASFQKGVRRAEKAGRFTESGKQDHDSNVSLVNNLSPSMSPKQFQSTSRSNNNSRSPEDIQKDEQLSIANKKVKFFAQKSNEVEFKNIMLEEENARLKKTIRELQNKALGKCDF